MTAPKTKPPKPAKPPADAAEISRKAKRNRTHGAAVEREFAAFFERHTGVALTRTATMQGRRRKGAELVPDLVPHEGHQLRDRVWIEVKGEATPGCLIDAMRQCCASGRPVIPIAAWRRPGKLKHGDFRWVVATTMECAHAARIDLLGPTSSLPDVVTMGGTSLYIRGKTSFAAGRGDFMLRRLHFLALSDRALPVPTIERMP